MEELAIYSCHKVNLNGNSIQFDEILLDDRFHLFPKDIKEIKMGASLNPRISFDWFSFFNFIYEGKGVGEVILKDNKDCYKVTGVLLANQILTIVRSEAECIKKGQRLSTPTPCPINRDLIGRFCHEINNSLAIVRGVKELLAHKDNGEHGNGASLQLIGKAIGRIENLTQGFHVLGGMDDLEQKDLCLHQVIEHALALMDIIYDWKGFNVRKKLEATKCMVRVSERQLIQTIMSVLSVFWNNLLVNKESSLTIETYNTDDSIHIIFWDNCLTSKESEYSLDHTRIPKSMIDFTMSIIQCHAVVKSMGGRISLLNSDNNQKKYQITLPVIVDRGECFIKPKGSVLIMEPERTFRAIIQSYFQKNGYHCTTLENIQVADIIDRVKIGSFDFVVLNEAAGPIVETTFHVVQNAVKKARLILTASSDQMLFKQELGAKDIFIQKPFSLSELEELIDL